MLRLNEKILYIQELFYGKYRIYEASVLAINPSHSKQLTIKILNGNRKGQILNVSYNSLRNAVDHVNRDDFMDILSKTEYEAKPND